MYSLAPLLALLLSVWQSRWIRALWIVLALLLSGWLLNNLSTEQLPQLTLRDDRTFQCDTRAVDRSLPSFHIQTILYSGAESMARQLCASPAMARYYSAVEIYWLQRSELTARNIVEERYDLFWNRDRRVQSLVPNFDQYYEPVLTLPNYHVMWFSQTETPQLKPAYFYGRKLGLLEDMESNSHFLFPLNQLKQVGVDVSNMNITYYSSYYLLEDAFWRGEVNLISDGEWLKDKAGDRPLYATLIDDSSSMGNWYVSINRPRDIDCTLRDVLVNAIDNLAMKPENLHIEDGECQ